MRRVICGWVLLTFFAVPGAAQTSDEHQAQGYAFFAPGGVAAGGSQGTIHFGGGVEALVYKGLGVGGEIGYLAPTRSFGNGLGVFSADGSYHFLTRQRDQKLVPFVTSGYSLFFRSGTANLVNFGGGVNYWFRERTGLRVEFRDHIRPDYTTAHFWEFRIGVAFR
jgi:hypothetical protein